MPVSDRFPVFTSPTLDPRVLADRLQDSCLVCDPYVYGRPRFLAEPLATPASYLERLYEFSRRVGTLYDELAQIVEEGREDEVHEFLNHLLPEATLTVDDESAHSAAPSARARLKRDPA